MLIIERLSNENNFIKIKITNKICLPKNLVLIGISLGYQFN